MIAYFDHWVHFSVHRKMENAFIQSICIKLHNLRVIPGYTVLINCYCLLEVLVSLENISRVEFGLIYDDNISTVYLLMLQHITLTRENFPIAK